MIKPSVGRVVWFTPAKNTSASDHGGQPFAAIVAYVHSDTMINLAAFDHSGTAWAETSVTLLQDREPTESEREYGRFAEWMPFQVGQAKRHEGEAAKA